MPSTLSILVPAFNEATTLGTAVTRILKADTLGLERELVLVDDYSGDSTWEIMLTLADTHEEVSIHRHSRN